MNKVNVVLLLIAVSFFNSSSDASPWKLPKVDSCDPTTEITAAYLAFRLAQLGIDMLFNCETDVNPIEVEDTIVDEGIREDLTIIEAMNNEENNSSLTRTLSKDELAQERQRNKDAKKKERAEKRSSNIKNRTNGWVQKNKVEQAEKSKQRERVLIYSQEAESDRIALENEPRIHIVRAVEKTLEFLQLNPSHNSLHVHLFTGRQGPNGEPVFEAYVQNDTSNAYRILFYNNGPEIIILRIEPHLK